MSLGPTNNVSANRLSQTLRTQQMQETSRVEAQQPTTPSTELHGDAPVTPAVDPAIQAGAREATKGAEDAIRSRLEQIMEGPAGGPAPRRGLGASPLEGEQFVNRRTGKGRRTAANDTGVERPQLARQATDVQTSELPGSFEMAGKRTTSGTRLGSNETAPLPGLPGGEPPTGIA
jgi:hypothetical protein